MPDATVTHADTDALVKRISDAASCFTADLNAMPAESLDKSHGGKARTAYDLTYEVVGLNRVVAARAKGLDFPFDDSEGWVRAPEAYKNKANAIEDFESSVADLNEALSQVTQERLDAPVDTPFGAIPLGRLAEIVPRHIMYHSGQLNYIQTWLGDEEFHWG